MNPLWAVPPLVLLGGLLACGLLIRKVDEARRQVMEHLHALGEIHHGTASLRAATAESRASLEALGQR